MEAVAAMLPPKLPTDPVLLLALTPNELWFDRAVDAMLFAQDHGWPTIDGYSGHAPSNYLLPFQCHQGLVDLYNGLTFLKRSQDYPTLARRVIALGYPPDCADTSASH
jgi:hypothetical protein